MSCCCSTAVKLRVPVTVVRYTSAPRQLGTVAGTGPPANNILPDASAPADSLLKSENSLPEPDLDLDQLISGEYLTQFTTV